MARPAGPSSQAARIGDKLRALVEKASKTLALEITAELIETTPVDTGFARANWIPSIGSPATTTDGNPEAVTTAAQKTGESEVLRFRINDQVIYVSNNVPYIKQLNLGHSQQAPAGFVEAAIDKALATVRGRFADLTIDLATSGAGTFSDDAGGAAAENVADFYSPLGGEP